VVFRVVGRGLNGGGDGCEKRERGVGLHAAGWNRIQKQKEQTSIEVSTAHSALEMQLRRSCTLFDPARKYIGCMWRHRIRKLGSAARTPTSVLGMYPLCQFEMTQQCLCGVGASGNTLHAA
jgi:hypothetical protein